MKLPRYFTVNDRPVRITAAGSGMRVEALRKDGRYEPAPEYLSRCIPVSDGTEELDRLTYDMHAQAWEGSFRR